MNNGQENKTDDFERYSLTCPTFSRPPRAAHG
jgi:hypothetical protein